MAFQNYVLLAEDKADAAALVQSLLQEAAGQPVGEVPFSGVHWVQTVAAALRMLDSEPGCAALLLGLDVPDSQGLEALAAIRAHAPEVPVIVMLPRESAALGLAAVVAGAQDYLVKGHLDAGLLGRVLQYAAQRKTIESALVERTLQDVLTGLPKRRLLLDRLGIAMKRCARDGSSGALLFVNLNRFTQVNEVHGHVAGDAVLRAVGARLTGLVRSSDTVARVGGDGFVVLLPHESGLLESLAIGEKLIDALDEPVSVNGSDVELSASIGVARFRDATEPAQVLLQRADAAMHAGRTDRKGRVRLL